MTDTRYKIQGSRFKGQGVNGFNLNLEFWTLDLV